MKTKLYLTTTILISAAVLSLSSCLKDPRLVDFSTVTPVVNFPLGGTENFGADAVTETPDTDANGTIVLQFSVDIASVKAPTTATTVTLAIDNTIVTSYNALGGAVTYLPMPAGTFVFASPTTVTIPAGQHTAIVSVTFYKNLLNPSSSYMLPIKIASASAGTISGNFGIHYFHFIGNDFAGGYEHFYTRWSDGDSTTVASTPREDIGPITGSPVGPNEFYLATGYYTAPRYDITFTKTGSGASATYSNWSVTFLAADIAAGSTWADNITVIDGPKIRSAHLVFDPNAQYTYAQSLELFRFYFQTSSRAIIDDFVHN